MNDPRYVPPPAFAPPELRAAPVNEIAVLGRTTYPPQSSVPAIAWQDVTIVRSGTRRRGVTVTVSACVIIALVTISAVLLAGVGTRQPRSLQLPEAFDNYARVSTLNGAEVQTLFAAGPLAGVSSADLADALVGVYADVADSAPNLLFIGFSADASPTIGSGLRAGPSETVAREVLNGAGATSPPKSADAGPLGGALRCARIDLDGNAATVGVWADRDTLGIVLIADTVTVLQHAPLSPQRTAAVTRDLRAAAEH